MKLHERSPNRLDKLAACDRMSDMGTAIAPRLVAPAMHLADPADRPRLNDGHDRLVDLMRMDLDSHLRDDLLVAGEFREHMAAYRDSP